MSIVFKTCLTTILGLLTMSVHAAAVKNIAYVHGEVDENKEIRYTVNASGNRIENADYDPTLTFHQMMLDDTGREGTSEFRELVEGLGHAIEPVRDVDFELAPGSLTSRPDKKFLSNYDCVVFSLHQRVWSAADAAALRTWIEAGGTMLIYSDSAAGGRGGDNFGQTAVNSLLGQFGMYVLRDNGGGTRQFKLDPPYPDAPIINDGVILEAEGISAVAVDPSESDIQVLLPLETQFWNQWSERTGREDRTPEEEAWTKLISNQDGIDDSVDWKWACLAYRPVGAGKVLALFDRQPIWNRNINPEDASHEGNDNRVIVQRMMEFLTEDGLVGGSVLPTADLEISTLTPRVGDSVFFDGSGSTDDSPLTYRFFLGRENGDNTGNWIRVINTTGSLSFSYDLPGTYRVRLVVIDSDGNEDKTSWQDVVVSEAVGGGSATLLQDTYVHKNKQTSNFDGRNLRVSNAGRWVTYLEFDVSDFSGAQNGLLSLFCTNSGNGQIDVFYDNTHAWKEDELTYATAGFFDAGDKVGEIDSTYNSGFHVDISLGGMPLDGDTITLILICDSSTNSTVFDSKESTSNADRKPMLDILPVGGG